MDGEPLDGNKIGLTSIMRSGNAFLRRKIEHVSGIATGSARCIHVASGLQILGSKGETHYDDKVWISRSHHPTAMPGSDIPNEVNKTLVIVRNPLDFIVSCANLAVTNSHAVKADYNLTDYPEWWDWFVTDYCARFSR